jgi:hypothetical protein
MSDDNVQKRAQKIVSTVPSIQRRIGGNEVRSIPKGPGSHASTNPKSKRITINSDWAGGVTDKRLQATLYHESMHVQQLDQGMSGKKHLPIMEFHAHTRELRHAMKHDLYSPQDMEGKLNKINKYGDKVKAKFPEFSDNVDRQLGRIEKGDMPAKHSVKYWTNKLGD